MNRKPTQTRYAPGQKFIKLAARHDFAIIDAVQQGIVTRRAIANHLGLGYNNVAQMVRDLIDADVLESDRDGILSMVEVAKLG